MAEILFAELCHSVNRNQGSSGSKYLTEPSGLSSPVSRDIDGGVSGIVLGLARAAVELRHANIRETLLELTRWLASSKWLPGGPLPGLYVGEAGIGIALLCAGLVLDRDELISVGLAKGRLVAQQPHSSPDMFNGTAGRLRFHLALWCICCEREQLRAAVLAGEHLLKTAESTGQHELFWRIPKEGYAHASGKVYLGYAHGAAGIADALLDLFEVTGEQRFADAAAAAGRWLLARAMPSLDDGAGLDWPVVENGRRIGGMWCHGATGIGRFFLHCAMVGVLRGSKDTALRAAATAAGGVRWSGASQCHGLVGSGEFLLDMFRVYEDTSLLCDAQVLCSLLHPFAFGVTDQRGGSDEVDSPRLDYMTGKAGIADFVLRLSAPDRLPHLLSLSGFLNLSNAELRKVRDPRGEWQPEPSVAEVTTEDATLREYSLFPAFNALAQPDVRGSIKNGDFTVLQRFGVDLTFRRLLQAAADDLPDRAHESFALFFENAVPPNIAGNGLALDVCQDGAAKPGFEAMCQLGEALRSIGYDNSPSAGPLARFALGYPVTTVELSRDLPRRVLSVLMNTGLATCVANCQHQLKFSIASIDSTMAVVPRSGSYADLVYAGSDSMVLLELALRFAPSGDRAAELGAGTGLTAAVLARRYRMVVATDIRMEIVRCISLTFALNRLWPPKQCLAVLSDVASGLEEGTFDLIIGNPPWVPSAATAGQLFADGGPTGFELPRRFILEGAHLLRPGGIALLLVSDATFCNNLRPLHQVCDYLKKLGYTTEIIPLESPESARRSWEKLLAKQGQLETTQHSSENGIIDIRVVALIISRPHKEVHSRDAFKAATAYLARRLRWT